VSDQFTSMNLVLANGDFVTIDPTSDLWWGMQGAGHNFGIVTSATTKIYDIRQPNWAIETIIFSGDKVEAVYQAANKYILNNGTQSADIINWSYWLNDATLDTLKVSRTLHRNNSSTNRFTLSAHYHYVHYSRRCKYCRPQIHQSIS
jgi:FAD/FMN-containing dehydrogenase